MCLIDGEQQLVRYVAAGNGQAQASWRQQVGIGWVFPMRTTPYPAPPPLPLGNYLVTFGWCVPGLMLYNVQRRRIPQPHRAPARQRQRQQQPQSQTTWDRVAEFVRQLIDMGGRNVEQAIRQFLMDNRDLINLVIGVGIAGIAATIIEDIATAGAGLFDDPLIVYICGQMIRIAATLRRFATTARTAAPVLAPAL
jgi:hypothetical protein